MEVSFKETAISTKHNMLKDISSESGEADLFDIHKYERGFAEKGTPATCKLSDPRPPDFKPKSDALTTWLHILSIHLSFNVYSRMMVK